MAFSPLPSDTFDAIRHLRAFLHADTDLTHREDVGQALSKLDLVAIHVAQSGINVELMAMIPWPYLIPETIMSDIKHRRPHALIVLAYFTPLLAILDRSFWFMRDWGKRLLRDIDSRLEDWPLLREYLKWPDAHV